MGGVRTFAGATDVGCLEGNAALPAGQFHPVHGGRVPQQSCQALDIAGFRRHAQESGGDSAVGAMPLAGGAQRAVKFNIQAGGAGQGRGG